VSKRTATVSVTPPFRLDLTATVLRRLSTNVVDVFDGTAYRRLLDAAPHGDPSNPTSVTVVQSAPDTLRVTLEGPHAPAVDVDGFVRRTFGTDVTLDAFGRGAKRFPWLHRIARAARGVKPPRYPSLWETACNAIVYQQISIHAAGAILRRVVERFAEPRELGGVRLSPFPPVGDVLAAGDADLRALGLSAGKVAALRSVGEAIVSRALDEALLESMPTADLLVHLAQHRGIGPWTAAVIALRGFGRLDVFPMNDSGATALLRTLSGDAAIAVEPVIEALAPQQGMLYYHLLLGRLAKNGEVKLA